MRTPRTTPAGYPALNAARAHLGIRLLAMPRWSRDGKRKINGDASNRDIPIMCCNQFYVTEPEDASPA